MGKQLNKAKAKLEGRVIAYEAGKCKVADGCKKPGSMNKKKGM